ncbi:5879_t:CDS:2 [Paraglomus brasilianum]|uniref:5879_t:CDS:1 n=1 Tax=Paraglomus brasilianum TaxID=144538 RepID=A0A9N8W1P4_9GLOM|nr:5879_t:CDS:2 [Paraglomus brasilianum]
MNIIEGQLEIVLSLVSFRTSRKEAAIVMQLENWCYANGALSGTQDVLGPGGCAILASSEEKEQAFPPVAPTYIVELRSQSNSPQDVHRKMRRWMEGGVDFTARMGMIFPDDHVNAEIKRQEHWNLPTIPNEKLHCSGDQTRRLKNDDSFPEELTYHSTFAGRRPYLRGHYSKIHSTFSPETNQNTAASNTTEASTPFSSEYSSPKQSKRPLQDMAINVQSDFCSTFTVGPPVHNTHTILTAARLRQLQRLLSQNPLTSNLIRYLLWTTYSRSRRQLELNNIHKCETMGKSSATLPDATHADTSTSDSSVTIEDFINRFRRESMLEKVYCSIHDEKLETAWDDTMEDTMQIPVPLNYPVN